MKKQARFFKALADETRLQILWLLLGEEELCVCDVAATVTASASGVSHHLRLLIVRLPRLGRDGGARLGAGPGLGRAFGLRGREQWLFTLGLAQAGEFGFVLLSFTVANNVIPAAIADQLLLVVALSMLPSTDGTVPRWSVSKLLSPLDSTTMFMGEHHSASLIGSSQIADCSPSGSEVVLKVPVGLPSPIR